MCVCVCIYISISILKIRICAFGIHIVRCMSFCLSLVNYLGVCVCYVLSQLCFRVSGFNLKKEAVSFRNVVDCVEYFYDSGKKIAISAADTTFVTALSKMCMLQRNGKFGCWYIDVSWLNV